MELLLLLFLLIVLALPTILMNRRQKTKMSEIQKLQDALQPGDRVVTTAGLHATVVTVAEELITLETSPGVVSTWEKLSVVRVVAPNMQPVQEVTEADGFTEQFPPAASQAWDPHPDNDDENRSGGHPENR